MAKLQQYRIVNASPMPRWARAIEQFRSYWAGPWSLKDRELAGHFSDRPPVSSGVNVSETTALNYAAVWSAVNGMSSDIASLPLMFYKREADGGKTRYPTHPLYKLLHDRPNPEMTSVVFRKVLHAHVLTWGNGYAEIERDQADRPKALWLLTPDRVQPFRRTQDAPLQYKVGNPGGGEVILDQRDVLHIPGLGWDGMQGYSVIQKARESIGLGVAAEQFGGTFFGNGATMGGTVSYKGPKPPEMADKNYTDALMQKHQGVGKAHQLLALYNDAKYERMGIPPNDAQFLETRQFQITEIARWFNMPPHRIGDLSRATFSNIEQQSIDYYTQTLVPWLTVWEQELGFKLIAPLEQNIQLIEHVADGFLRGDASGRAASYQSQFNVGGITPNEVRASENRNKVAGGDRAFVQAGLVPLDRIDEIINAEIKSKTASTDTQQNLQRQVEQLTEDVALARKKAQAEEDANDRAQAALVERTAELHAERDAHAATILTMAAREDEATTRAGELDATKTDLTNALSANDVIVQREAERETYWQTRWDKHVSDQAGTDRARDHAHAEALQAARDAAAALVDAAKEATVTAETRATDIEAKLGIAEAVIVELRAAREPLDKELAEARAVIIEAREGLTRIDAQYVAAEAARVALETALATRTAALAETQARLTDAGAAVRAVLVDGLHWLIEREADRARRVQGSPDKLRKWVEQFYPAHDELCRKILRPSVRAWVVCLGHPEPVEHVLDLLVAKHIDQSIRQLRLVADEHTAETLAPALEKILRRWEGDRADTLVDRVLREAA